MLAADLASAIQHNFDAVRKSLEERRYADAQDLLARQRELFSALDFEDPEARELLNRARDFVSSALMLARVHHAHTERAFAAFLKLKQLDTGYLPSPVCSAELVSVRG